MPEARPCRFVETEDAFAQLLVELARAPALAVDTESNSFHAYFERVCLIQISTEGSDYAIDPRSVDVRPLGRLFADPSRELIFHAADFDVRGLKRDFGFRFGRIFDTMLSARLLGLPGLGLAALVRERFGVVMAKEHQRSDWGRRPLSQAQLEYAYRDTRYLLPLRRQLGAELESAGKLAAAGKLFAGQAACMPRKRRFDEEGFRKMRGFLALDATERAAVRALYLLRERCARDSDRPPFKVLGDEAIVELARRCPHDERELVAVRGVGGQTVRRHGQAILAALNPAGEERAS